MSPVHFLVAVALLTGSSDVPPDPSETELVGEVLPSLQQLSVDLEILDPREVKYVLNRSEDFNSDLKLLRRRFHDLADAPYAFDAHRFLDRNSINELLGFNRTFRQNLETRQSLDLGRSWELREAVQETDRLYQIWDTLRDARCEYYYVTVRRQALKRLQDLIGETAYQQSVMPPHVPVWRFQPVD